MIDLLFYLWRAGDIAWAYGVGMLLVGVVGMGVCACLTLRQRMPWLLIGFAMSMVAAIGGFAGVIR